ncbi:MAG: M23 family metallopeptidase [Ferruginibacter sp.]|nr:M23 family metallopeptidase [Ferruginibacter sp.]
MANSFINPTDLPLVPPMDLNQHLPGIDRISPFPMQLRTQRNVGLFYARREADPVTGRQTLIRPHTGIDLLAPKGTKVFAAAGGKVIDVNPGNILMLHDFGFKFMTFYNHVQNILVKVGDIVSPGHEICEVNDNPNWPTETHLHFELRYPFESSTFTRKNSLPINTTFVLYNWEVKSFENDNNNSNRNVYDNTVITSYEEVVRDRQLRFVKINVRANNRDLYLPLQTGLFEDQHLADTIRAAFMANKTVRIAWRESLYFSKIQTVHDKVGIIVEIKML